MARHVERPRQGNAKTRGSRTGPTQRPPSRRKRRQQERSARKASRAAFFSRRKAPASGPASGGDGGEGKRARNTEPHGYTKPAAMSGPPKSESKVVPAGARAGLPRPPSTGHRRQLLLANQREEREISKLEKLLRMKRRKNLPASFRDEGLDYVLDLVDGKGVTDWLQEEEDPGFDRRDSSSEPEELDSVTRPSGAWKNGQSVVKSSGIVGEKGGNSKTRTDVRLVTSTVEDMEEEEEEEEEEGEEEEGEEEEGEEEEEDELEEEEGGEKEERKGEVMSESGLTSDSDGYLESEGSEEGFDERGGGGSKDDMSPASRRGRYLPPHQRARQPGADQRERQQKLERLRRRMQGLINRLSESNMHSVSAQIEQLFYENSRNDMNSLLTEVLLKACISPVLPPERFSMEGAMLVAILHSNVGAEVGAHVVQTLVKRFEELHSTSSEGGRSGKEANCVLQLLSFLYNFKVIHCVLIYDIIRKLVDSFGETDVELLLLLLKNTGMEIRRDDASSLKDIILQIQAMAASSLLKQSPRVRFMLETIAALRTNNARKIPNYDPTLVEHAKRLLRGLVRSTGATDEGQLKISLQDLLKADEQGRWWVIGSAWSGREGREGGSKGASSSSSSSLPSFEGWVLDLARKQRMSTDVRRNIFCVLVTSEDYTDALEKLLRLGLNDVQEREIVHVLVDCCLQEKVFNPFYAFLGQKLCELKRSHQVTFQYALWDRFKDLTSLSRTCCTNLSRLCAHLISSRVLSLAVLRVVEFAELDKTGVKLFKSLLSSLLFDSSEDTCRAMFARIAPLPHLRHLRDEILVFIKHYLSEANLDSDPRAASGVPDLAAQRASRVRIAEQALSMVGHLF